MQSSLGSMRSESLVVSRNQQHFYRDNLHIICIVSARFLWLCIISAIIDSLTNRGYPTTRNNLSKTIYFVGQKTSSNKLQARKINSSKIAVLTEGDSNSFSRPFKLIATKLTL